MSLQENKAVNLNLAISKVNGIIIEPGQTFSFWKLVGSCTKRKGFKEGLIIKNGQPSQGIGGGMCQFTNMLHWLVLHSPLTITEHHHHNHVDLFPDYGRQIPFGSGTSIMYNYLDYQFINNTDKVFQLIIYTDDTYIHGELRSNRPTDHSYHIQEENAYFSREGNDYFRNNEIYREVYNKTTGLMVNRKLLVKNHAKVMYSKEYIPEDRIQLLK